MCAPPTCHPALKGRLESAAVSVGAEAAHRQLPRMFSVRLHMLPCLWDIGSDIIHLKRVRACVHAFVCVRTQTSVWAQWEFWDPLCRWQRGSDSPAVSAQTPAAFSPSCSQEDCSCTHFAQLPRAGKSLVGRPKGHSWKLQFTLGGGQGWVGPHPPSTQLRGK